MDDEVPIAIRAIAAVLAGLGPVLMNIVTGTALLASAPIVAAGHLLVGIPFFLVLAWIAVYPEHAAPRLRRWLSVDLREARNAVGLFIHLAFAYLVFGTVIIGTARGASQLLATGEHPASAGALTDAGLVISLVANLLLFVVAAVTWIWLVDGQRGSRILEDLRLELKHLPMGIVWGVATVIGVFLAMFAIVASLQAVGYAPSNPQADAIADALTARPGLAVLVAALAGLGEEIYFRGFLLERLGNWPQAILFGALHATYLTPLQVVLPFLLGLAFGYVVRKTSLWAAIFAHTAFNAVQLLASIYQDELAHIAGWLLG